MAPSDTWRAHGHTRQIPNAATTNTTPQNNPPRPRYGNGILSGSARSNDEPFSASQARARFTTPKYNTARAKKVTLRGRLRRGGVMRVEFVTV